jgi:hypothetical protein
MGATSQISCDLSIGGMSVRKAGLVLSLCLLAAAVFAQSMPTTNILTRMTMIQSRYGRGSVFSIDVDQREYWITAKHILTGAKHPPYGSVTDKSVSLSILDPGASQERWIPITFSVIDPGSNVDIVVLAAPTPLLSNPFPSAAVTSAGVTLGGECEFLGFPYGGGWRANFDNGQSTWMPFVKHCHVSAIADEDLKIWVLDGINNEGFSGGPVIWRTGADQRIMAVISGYMQEPGEVVPAAASSSGGEKKSTKSSRSTKEKVNLNSGFIIAFDIAPAIDAIRKRPVGPMRGTAH